MISFFFCVCWEEEKGGGGILTHTYFFLCFFFLCLSRAMSLRASLWYAFSEVICFHCGNSLDGKTPIILSKDCTASSKWKECVASIKWKDTQPSIKWCSSQCFDRTGDYNIDRIHELLTTEDVNDSGGGDDAATDEKKRETKKESTMKKKERKITTIGGTTCLHCGKTVGDNKIELIKAGARVMVWCDHQCFGELSMGDIEMISNDLDSGEDDDDCDENEDVESLAEPKSKTKYTNSLARGIMGGGGSSGDDTKEKTMIRVRWVDPYMHETYYPDTPDGLKAATAKFIREANARRAGPAEGMMDKHGGDILGYPEYTWVERVGSGVEGGVYEIYSDEDWPHNPENPDKEEEEEEEEEEEDDDDDEEDDETKTENAYDRSKPIQTWWGYDRSEPIPPMRQHEYYVTPGCDGPNETTIDGHKIRTVFNTHVTGQGK